MTLQLHKLKLLWRVGIRTGKIISFQVATNPTRPVIQIRASMNMVPLRRCVFDALKFEYILSFILLHQTKKCVRLQLLFQQGKIGPFE